MISAIYDSIILSELSGLYTKVSSGSLEVIEFY